MAPDAFEVLGLAARFDIPRDEVERRYLTLVSSQHPDTTHADDRGQARAAALNDARAVLANPEQRAGLMLARLGGPSAEQDKSLPPSFLAEIMDVRESVDGAARSGDPARVDEWRSWARDRRVRMIAEVGELFAGLASPPAPGTLAAIRRSLNAWRYVERMVEQIDGAAA